jgi:hypothetical protein
VQPFVRPMPKKYGDPFEFGLVDSGHFVVFR